MIRHLGLTGGSEAPVPRNFERTLLTYRRIGRLVIALTVGSGVGVIVGCGSEKDDMVARAMQRRRSVDPEDEISSNKPNPISKPTADAAGSGADPAPSAVPIAAVAESTGIKPIGERSANTPLTEMQRRTRTVENLKAIQKAINAYADDHGVFPPAKMITPAGFDSISWRVLVLPYMGYQDLYKQFDTGKRWDEEPNLSLLPLIPDEYVSPDRFDEKTNYQVPINAAFVFGEKQSKSFNGIEDGLESTIYLIEVDDDRAVPWIKPADYEISSQTGGIAAIKSGIGKLRGEGTYAIWGSGYPVLLNAAVSNNDLMNAFRIDDGDSQIAARIHRDIALDKPLPDDAAKQLLASTELTELAESPSNRDPPMQFNAAPVAATDRREIPPAIEIDVARSRLDGLYENQLRDAVTEGEKARLANDLLSQAARLQTDPAGMYAMIELAKRLSIEAAAGSEFLLAVDAKVGRFEVDAYRTNMDSLTEFFQLMGRSKNDPPGQRRLLGRIIRTIDAALQSDDFDGAIALLRIASRNNSSPRNSVIPDLINQLTVKLVQSSSTFTKVKQSLVDYRENPEDKSAATTVGRYLCFVKGDWEGGLPLLAQNDDGAIGELASLDWAATGSATSVSSSEQIAIGDAWWQMGERATLRTYRDGAVDRAMYWYSATYDDLPPSLDRMHVKARLDEGESAAGSPLGLLRRLAKQTNVDLSVPLWTVNVRGDGGDNDDDDDDDD